MNPTALAIAQTIFITLSAAGLGTVIRFGVFTYWGHRAMRDAGDRAERASLAREFALRVLDAGRAKSGKKTDSSAPPGDVDGQDG